MARTGAASGATATTADRLVSSWNPYALLAAIVAALYGRTLSYGFTYLDDDLLILRNFSAISHFSNIGAAFRTLYFGPYYRPLIQISLIFDAQISGMSPWMYHLSNLLFHLIACGLAFHLIARLLGSQRAALPAASLLAVIPIATQSVAWIPGRNDTLLAIFLLLSMITLMRVVAAMTWPRFALHFLMFFLALLTKEAALAFPAVGLGYLILLARRPWKSREVATCAAGWIASLGIWLALRASALGQIHPSYTAATLVSNLRTILEILGKTILPIRLSPYPSFDLLSLVSGAVVVVAVALLLARSAQLHGQGHGDHGRDQGVDQRRDQGRDHGRDQGWDQGQDQGRIRLFALLWALAFLLPGLFVHVAESEHRFAYLESRAYPSLFGLALFMAGGLFPQGRFRFGRRGAILFVALFCALAARTAVYSAAFHDAISHWEYAVRMTPRSDQAQFSLGVAYMDTRHDLARAAACYEKSAALNPGYSPCHNNLGIIYGQQGKLDRAEEQFRQAAALDSTDALPLSNLGYVRFLHHDLPAAERLLLKALARDSLMVDALVNLQNVYHQQGRTTEEQACAARLERARKAAAGTGGH